MNKLEIEIALNGNLAPVAASGPQVERQLRFVLKAPILKTPQNGMDFPPRPMLDSLNDSLRKLRFGDAPAQLVSEVTAKVSEWFLSSDLNGQLQTAINLSGNGEPIRLVFSINDDQVRSDLADVPFELIMLRGTGQPLVLNPNIAGFVHVLPRTEAPSTRVGNWPLKVLILRSNPKDLGGAIPPADPIRQKIRKILEDEPALSPELVRVDILSSEGSAGLAGRPTTENLESQLAKVQYDILIYVGHGDISTETVPGKQVGGVLQLEDDAGEHRRVLEARILARTLGERNSLPVVLLLGCLTAAEDIPEDQREGVRELMPQWLRGSQGVAQVLIDSQSGVQFVVGMRYKIDTQNALDFLSFFFRNLLKIRPGNVEAAVRAARLKLEENTYMWSAPVVFSTLCEEPLFGFIEEPPKCPTFEASQVLRNLVWTNLSRVNWNLRDQRIPAIGKLLEDWHTALKDSEQEIIQQMNNQKAILIGPGFGEFKSGEEVKLPVRLFGSMKGVEEIEGQIVIGGAPVTITRLEPAQTLADRNYQLASMDNNTGFLIRSRNGGGSLETGDLFNIVFTVPALSQVVLPISVSKIKTRPVMTICPGGNAVIVPPP